jgi:hypothetical protein
MTKTIKPRFVLYKFDTQSGVLLKKLVVEHSSSVTSDSKLINAATKQLLDPNELNQKFNRFCVEVLSSGGKQKCYFCLDNSINVSSDIYESLSTRISVDGVGKLRISNWHLQDWFAVAPKTNKKPVFVMSLLVELQANGEVSECNIEYFKQHNSNNPQLLHFGNPFDAAQDGKPQDVQTGLYVASGARKGVKLSDQPPIFQALNQPRRASDQNINLDNFRLVSYESAFNKYYPRGAHERISNTINDGLGESYADNTKVVFRHTSANTIGLFFGRWTAYQVSVKHTYYKPFHGYDLCIYDSGNTRTSRLKNNSRYYHAWAGSEMVSPMSLSNESALRLRFRLENLSTANVVDHIDKQVMSEYRLRKKTTGNLNFLPGLAVIQPNVGSATDLIEGIRHSEDGWLQIASDIPLNYRFTNLIDNASPIKHPIQDWFRWQFSGAGQTSTVKESIPIAVRMSMPGVVNTKGKPLELDANVTLLKNQGNYFRSCSELKVTAEEQQHPQPVVIGGLILELDKLEVPVPSNHVDKSISITLDAGHSRLISSNNRSMTTINLGAHAFDYNVNFVWTLKDVSPLGQDLTEYESVVVKAPQGLPLLVLPTSAKKQAITSLKLLASENKSNTAFKLLKKGGSDHKTNPPLWVMDQTPFLHCVVDLENSFWHKGKDNEVAEYRDGIDGVGWRFTQTNQIKMILPPQGIGEAAEKAVEKVGLPEFERLSQNSYAECRFSPPATLFLQTSYYSESHGEAPWNLRRLFGWPGQRAPGSLLKQADFELLYGMSLTFSPKDTYLADLLPKLGALAIKQSDRPGDEHWESVARQLNHRLSFLEPWRKVNNLTPEVFDEQVQYWLRSSAQMAYPVDLQYTNEATKKGLKAPKDKNGLQGGVGWMFESRNVYESVWRDPKSNSGSISGLAFTALGGYGKQKAVFDNRRTAIHADVGLGRTHYTALERVGRIGVFWHKAKHVIIYERSTSRSKQFAKSQDPHRFRPVLRKVLEYVEILQDERDYPESGNFPEKTGMINGCKFKTKVIRVDSAWGRDVSNVGWEIPLWQQGMDSEIYPKPQIEMALWVDPDSGQDKQLIPLKCPNNLYFFTNTQKQFDDDTEQWPSVLGVDFNDEPILRSAELLPVQAHDIDGRLNDDEEVAAGFSRFTYALAENNVEVNMTAKRAQKSTVANVKNVSMMRSVPNAMPIVAETAGKLSHHKQLIRLERECRDLMKIWKDALSGNPLTLPKHLNNLKQKTLLKIEALEGSLDELHTKISSDSPCKQLKTLAKSKISTQAEQLTGQAAALRDRMLEQIEQQSEEWNSVLANLVSDLDVYKNNLITNLNLGLDVASNELAQVRVGINNQLSKLNQTLDSVKSITEPDNPDTGQLKIVLKQLRQALAHVRQPLELVQNVSLSRGLSQRVRIFSTGIWQQLEQLEKNLNITLSTIDLDQLKRDVSLLRANISHSSLLKPLLIRPLEDLFEAIGNNADIDNEVIKFNTTIGDYKAQLADFDNWKPEQGVFKTLIEKIKISAKEMAGLLDAVSTDLQNLDIEASQQQIIAAVTNTLDGIENKGKDFALHYTDITASGIDYLKRELHQLQTMTDVSVMRNTVSIIQNRLLQDIANLEQEAQDKVMAFFESQKSSAEGLLNSLIATLEKGDFNLQVIKKEINTLSNVLLFNSQQLQQFLNNYAESINQRLQVPRENVAVFDTALKDAIKVLDVELRNPIIITRVTAKKHINLFYDKIEKGVVVVLTSGLTAVSNKLIDDMCNQLDLKKNAKEFIKPALTLLKNLRTAINEADKGIDAINQQLEKWQDKFDDVVNQVKEDASDKIKSVVEDFDQGLLQKGDSTIRLIRAFADVPKLPQLDFNRRSIGYYYDMVENGVDLTPCSAYLDNIGNELKGIGVRLPTKHLLEQLDPYQYLPKFNFREIFPNFAGINLANLIPDLDLPSLPKDKVKITHGIDKQTRRAWANADIDIHVKKKTSLLDIGVLRMDLIRPHFEASTRLSSDIQGDTSSNAHGQILGDWQMTVGGLPIINFVNTPLTFDQDEGVKFDVKPENIRMEGAMKILADVIKIAESVAGKAEDALNGLNIELVKNESGLPIGATSSFGVALNPVTTGAFTFSNISFGAQFGLMAAPEFNIFASAHLARSTSPMTMLVSFLGGAAWLETEVRYFPGTSDLQTRLDLSLAASAGIALNVGIIRGSIMFYIGLRILYTSSRLSRDRLEVALYFLMVGSASLGGFASVGVRLRISAVYSNNKMSGRGTMSYSVKISRFFKLKVRQRVEYKF